MNPTDGASPLPDIRDIASPDSLLSPWEIVAWVAAILVILALLGIGGFFLYRALMKDKRTPVSPQAKAMRKLNGLAAEMDGKSPNEFSLAVSETLKDYLAARFGDPLRYETSEEFLWRLSEARANALPSSIRDQVASFLTVSDEIKYGRPPDAEASKAPLLEQAREVIKVNPPAPPSQGSGKPRRRSAPPSPPKRRKTVS